MLVVKIRKKKVAAQPMCDHPSNSVGCSSDGLCYKDDPVIAEIREKLRKKEEERLEYEQAREKMLVAELELRCTAYTAPNGCIGDD